MASNTGGLRAYYDTLRGTENAKNDLIEDLLKRLDALNHDHEKIMLDHARETNYNREGQLRELSLKEELRLFRAMIERDQFILVLIDGDGMIFEDHLITRGEAGGKEAAHMLWAAVRDYVQQKIPGLSSDYKIVTRVYANLKGLGDVCHRAGILESPSIMEDFMRGFTGSKQLFDFIDVGSGKDRADDKVSELFKLYLYNCHCRHIIFGCSHDNGYARLLEDALDQSKPNQITLLEGVPFERELANLRSRYEQARFENLFRTTKINIYQQQYQPRPPSHPPTQSMPQMLTHQMHQLLPMQMMQKNGIQTGLPNGIPNGHPHPHVSTPVQGYQLPYLASVQSPMQRTPSASTNNNAMNPMAISWATKAVSAPPAQVASPPPTPQPQDNGNKIPRNKYGQRIDPAISCDKAEVKRVQKIKMCNVHFLRSDCPYGEKCTHDHFYKPNKNEIATLRYVARQTPCFFSTLCEDSKCIYGHRCPSSIEGSKDCNFGDNCRFDKDMHGIDLKVVRTTKVS